MTYDDTRLTLEQGMAASEMSYDQLWLRYVAVGGTAGTMELEAYVLGLLDADPYQHDVIAQGINEHFIDLAQNHPVGYWRETHGD